jgi:uncharacterized protein (DUF2062 family)
MIDSPALIAMAVGATMAFGAGALVSYVGARRDAWTPLRQGRRSLQKTWKRLAQRIA